MQDAIDAVANAQLVFRRLKMNIGRAVLVGLPDHLVDKFNHAGFLVAFGDFFVRWQLQIQRCFFLQFSQRLGPDTVEIF